MHFLDILHELDFFELFFYLVFVFNKILFFYAYLYNKDNLIEFLTLDVILLYFYFIVSFLKIGFFMFILSSKMDLSGLKDL